MAAAPVLLSVTELMVSPLYKVAGVVLNSAPVKLYDRPYCLLKLLALICSGALVTVSVPGTKLML